MIGMTSLSSNLNENSNKRMKFHESVVAADLETARSLLQGGVDVNCVEETYLFTPLHYAARNRDLQMVNLLLEYGADVNAKSKRGWNALHVLSEMNSKGSKRDAGTYDICSKIVFALLRAGSNLEAADCLGRTPLRYSCHQNDVNVLAALLQYGADINSRDFRLRSVMVYVSHMTADMRAIVEPHVLKLRAIGFRTPRVFEYEQGRIRKKGYVDFIRRCEEEVQVMKSSMIVERLSLYDVIALEDEKLEALVGNIDLRKVVTSEEFEQKYPIYGFLLKLQYRRIEIMEGLDYAEDILSCKLRLPVLCIEHIFRCVTEQVGGFMSTSRFICTCENGDHKSDLELLN